MYEWLEKELKEVQTPRFHVVDGPASPELRAAVEESDLPVPPSYKEFVLHFGNASLYRLFNFHEVVVFASPRRTNDQQGLCFGRYSGAHASFKEALLVPGEESPVFEWDGRGDPRQVADGFAEWLEKRCRAVRKRLGRARWADILRGPAPFTEAERRIVEARRLYRWRVVGASPQGNVQFEVHNGSDMVLPFLSIGIRGVRRDGGELTGGIWLAVSSVRPGETAILEKDCYKEVVDPANVEAFPEPDPGPEDRDRYWEFRPLA